jgi:hypothetical protein
MSLRRHRSKIRTILFGYFWLPCPSCGHKFGGHEIANDAEVHYGAIPDPADRWSSRLICPACTAAGVGCVAYAERGMWHADCQFTTPPGDTDAMADWFRKRHRLSEDECIVILKSSEL